MEIKFDSYTVTGGIAVPTNDNPKPTEKDYYQRKEDGISWGDYYRKIYDAFEQWKQSHTYATNAPDGVYKVECFEPLTWQYKKLGEWKTLSKGAMCLYGSFQGFASYTPSEKRLFLPFIEQPEPFKKGDHVIMVNCGEADHYKSRVWECTSDSYKSKGGDMVTHLDGFVGSFLSSCLQKVDLPVTKVEQSEKEGGTVGDLPPYTHIWSPNKQPYVAQIVYSPQEVTEIIEKVLKRVVNNVSITGEWITNDMGKDVEIFGTIDNASILSTPYTDLLKK